MPGEAEAISAATGVLDIFARSAQAQQQNIQNFLNTASQNAANMALYREMRDYNAPKNQRKLLEEAGYNPNLLYGHGVVAASTPPQVQRPEYKAPDLSGWQQIAINDVNMDIIRANKEVAIAEARRVNAEADIAEDTAKKTLKQEDTTINDPWYMRMIDRARRGFDAMANKAERERHMNEIRKGFEEENKRKQHGASYQW